MAGATKKADAAARSAVRPSRARSAAVILLSFLVSLGAPRGLLRTPQAACDAILSAFMHACCMHSYFIVLYPLVLYALVL
jgi:hypothetical protein